jgi:glycine/D-amino acid oxidase-like deaminating enzyme
LKEKIGSDFFNFAKWNPDDFNVNPVRLVQLMAQEAERQGAVFLEGWDVRAIEDDTVICPHGTIKADLILYATNAYTPLLVPELQGRIFPTRGQVLLTEPTPQRRPGVCCITRFGHEYWHWMENGSLMVGGQRTVDETGEQGYDEQLNHSVQAALQSFIADVYPELATWPVRHRWSGIMAFTVDGLPFAGTRSGRVNEWIVGGYGGYGLGLFWGLTEWVTRALFDELSAEERHFLLQLSPHRTPRSS